MNNKVYILLLVILGSLAQSCSNTKFLAEDEKLYTYTWFSEKGFGKINNKPLKAYELYLVGNVKTNRMFYFLPRFNLTIHNYMQPTGKWGPRHYIYKVFQKPPVLLSEVDPEFRVKVMQQRMAEMGHFDSEIDVDIRIYGKDNKKARAKYFIVFKPAYTYRNFEFIPRPTAVDSIISISMDETLIQSGEDYWLDEMEQERERLSAMLRNQGYYYFDPGHLIYHADTTVGEKQVDLRLKVKDDIPAKAYNQYYIRDVNIHVRSNRPERKEFLPTDSTWINGYRYFSVGRYYRPKAITRHLALKAGDLYTYQAQENTLRYLQGMEAFRSVNVSFREVDSTSRQLDATIELVPVKPLQTSLEVNFATKSNDFLGPAAIGSIGHKNIFKGAEQLVFQLDGGFEWQKRSKRREYELGLNSYEIGGQVKLIVPRFLAPLKLKKQSERYVPKTYMSLGYRTLKRVKYYRMNLSQVRFGYTWRTSPKREFTLEPVSIDYLRLTETSSKFDNFLKKYPLVALSFEEQFIIGSVFSYTYSSNPKKRKFNTFYYNGTVDLAGNLLEGVYSVSGLKEKEGGGPGVLLGVPYSQYAKWTNDFRYYIYFHKQMQIATRFLAGVGVPYGNSEVLPYVKQYFAGGSQDIRAFYSRSIGPGSYTNTDADGSTLLDQSGEIKLMANIEYRFPITYKTNGAFFVDAGNVWLLKEDPSRPGGKFGFDTFLNEIAIGTGVGLRVDITYFVIRLDAAVPVHKPYIPGKGGWIFNDLGFFKDYILSLAVGYPF